MGAKGIFILVVEEMKVENHVTLFNQRGKVNNRVGLLFSITITQTDGIERQWNLGGKFPRRQGVTPPIWRHLPSYGSITAYPDTDSSGRTVEDRPVIICTDESLRTSFVLLSTVRNPVRTIRA